MNQSSEAATNHFWVYFQFAFNKYFKVTAQVHCWLTEKKKKEKRKNILILFQHDNQQKTKIFDKM